MSLACGWEGGRLLSKLISQIVHRSSFGVLMKCWMSRTDRSEGKKATHGSNFPLSLCTACVFDCTPVTPLTFCLSPLTVCLYLYSDLHPSVCLLLLPSHLALSLSLPPHPSLSRCLSSPVDALSVLFSKRRQIGGGVGGERPAKHIQGPLKLIIQQGFDSTAAAAAAAASAAAQNARHASHSRALSLHTVSPV